MVIRRHVDCEINKAKKEMQPWFEFRARQIEIEWFVGSLGTLVEAPSPDTQTSQFGNLP